MKKDMKKLYKKMSKGLDFFPFALNDDTLVIAGDYKDDIELPEGYSIEDGKVYFGEKAIGNVVYDGLKEEDEEEVTEEDTTDDSEDVKEEPVKKTTMAEKLASVKSSDEEDEEDEDDYDLESDLELADDDDYDSEFESTHSIVENERNRKTTKVDDSIEDGFKSHYVDFDDDEEETKEDKKDMPSLTEAEMKRIIESYKYVYDVPQEEEADFMNYLSNLKLNKIKEVNGVSFVEFIDEDGVYCLYDPVTGFYDAEDTFEETFKIFKSEKAKEEKEDTEVKSDEDELVKEVNKEIKKTNPNMEVKIDNTTDSDKEDKKTDIDVSESTNVFEVAQAIANLNKDAEIAVGDPENDELSDKRIFSSVPMEELVLPKGFKIDENTGITNEHNTKSGNFCAFKVEDIATADRDSLLILSSADDDLEVETKKSSRVRRFIQRTLYAITRFFKKGKFAKVSEDDDLVEDKEEKDEDKKVEDKEEKTSKKITKEDELSEKLTAAEERNEDLLKTASLYADKVKKLEEKIAAMTEEINELKKTKAIKVEATEKDADIKVDVTEPDKKEEVTETVEKEVSVEPDKKDGSYKFVFTSKEDTIKVFAEEDKAVKDKEAKEQEEVAKLEELTEKIAYYEKFLKEHALSHEEDKELRERMMSKLEYFREKYTEALEVKKNAPVEPDTRTEKMAYYTQTSKGIEQAISDLILERRTKELLLRSTNQFMSLKDARSYDERIAELKALKAECIGRRDAINATYVEEGNRILNAARSEEGQAMYNIELFADRMAAKDKALRDSIIANPSSKKVSELKEIAKDSYISGTKKMKKADLVSEIEHQNDVKKQYILK